MMKALEIAIEKLKSLPEDRQAYAAQVIEQIANSDDGVFRIPDAHRGEFASDDDMAALWRKCGL